MNAGRLAAVVARGENPYRFEIGDLTPHDERTLLLQLADCKRKFAGAPADSEESRDIPVRGPIRRRYLELRGRLALGRMKLVCHVAKRYRDRGIPYPDLMQEGFCGLLEAIDRFDVSKDNNLATYAMWWIRQRIQRAVAAGAYPVRLSPRCLRELAEFLRRSERTTRDVEPVPESALQPIPKVIGHLWALTRPTVRLDEVRYGECPLIDSFADPQGDAIGEVDNREILEELMRFLLPREKQVLYLRFGLEGQAQHSLSQASKLLGVSRERIRQIQERALEKLRDLV